MDEWEKWTRKGPLELLTRTGVKGEGDGGLTGSTKGHTGKVLYQLGEKEKNRKSLKIK